jgi:protein-tyrosine-phosphatase
VLGAGLAAGSAARFRSDVESPAEIVFVCKNGVAMSVWSAAYFNRLAKQRGIPQRAAARASVACYREIPLRMRLALALDGLDAGEFRPHVVSRDDVRAAERVIVIADAELPREAAASETPSERWLGFPPMRERYFRSRAALVERVEALAEELAARAQP